MQQTEIKITAANTAKIAAALDATQGRAVQRILVLDDVIDAIENAEKHLTGLGIPKKYWTGCVVLAEERFRLPNSYNYRADSTVARVERRAGGWYLVGVVRGGCGKDGGPRLTISEDALRHVPSSVTL